MKDSSTPVTLLQRLAQSVDQDTSERFVQQYRPEVKKAIARIVKEDADAEDLTQQFLVEKVMSGKLFAGYDRKKGRFRSYLHRACRYYAIGELRKSKKELNFDELPDAGSSHLDPERLILEPESQAYSAYLVALLDEVLDDVKAYADTHDMHLHYELFRKRFLDYEVKPPPWRVLASAAGLQGPASGRTAEQRSYKIVERVRKRFRERLADEAEEDAGRELDICERTLYGALAKSALILHDRFDLRKLQQLFGVINDRSAPPGNSDKAFQEQIDIAAQEFRPLQALPANFVEATAQNRVELSVLEDAKDLAKNMMENSTNQQQRTTANLLYHFTIAAAFRNFSENISTKSLTDRTAMYEELGFLDADPVVAAVFLGCVQLLSRRDYRD